MLIQTRETDYDVIPSGTYDGRFTGIEEKTNERGAYYIWRFEVTGKSGKTAEVIGSSPISFGPRAKAFGWAGAIRGKDFAPGEPINVDELVDRPCKVVVLKEPRRDGQGDRNAIVAVLPDGNASNGADADLPF